VVGATLVVGSAGAVVVGSPGIVVVGNGPGVEPPWGVKLNDANTLSITDACSGPVIWIWSTTVND
jgi:hypothetical protein